MKSVELVVMGNRSKWEYKVLEPVALSHLARALAVDDDDGWDLVQVLLLGL
jgi:hypothetical protein